MKPTWIVFVYNDKLQAAKRYRGDKEDIVGYVTCNKAKDAIDYAESMGFSNNHRTDCTPMAPWQRGEILYWYQQKLTLLAIAEKVNRSIDWVSIVCSINGRAREELINIYQDYKENNIDEREPKPYIKNTGGSVRKSISSRRKPNKAISTKPSRKKRRVQRKQTASKDYSRRTQTSMGRDKPRLRSIVDKLRKSKDYVGD